jgi:hypothetical protein
MMTVMMMTVMMMMMMMGEQATWRTQQQYDGTAIG